MSDLRSLFALTREVSPSLANCELSFVERSPIDLALANDQHHAYQRALQELGCELIALPAEDAWPDAVFVEDVALVLDELAVITRPGAASRRQEGESVAAVLAKHRPLRRIEEPGTLDGGDILRVGRTIFVGRSARSNLAGIDQLRELAGDYGYVVRGVPIFDCLHLKSAVTEAKEGTLLVQPGWIENKWLAGYELIEVDPGEPHAANVLRIGNGAIYPSSFPRTADKLAKAGVELKLVDLSELQKAEGAVTCCSLVFTSSAPPSLS
jgi:dimethylargininase